MYFRDNSSHGSVENRGVPRSRKLGGNDEIRFNGGTVVALRKYLKRMVPGLLEYAEKVRCMPSLAAQNLLCVEALQFERHCGSREDDRHFGA